MTSKPTACSISIAYFLWVVWLAQANERWCGHRFMKYLNRMFCVICDIQFLDILLPNKRGVPLPTATHRQIQEAEVGGEGKRSLLRGCAIWEGGNFWAPGSILLENPEIPADPRARNNAQDSCSILICPLELKAAKQMALWCQAPIWGLLVTQHCQSPLLLPVPGARGCCQLLWLAVWGLHCASYVASRAYQSHKALASKSMSWVPRKRGKRRSCFPLV